MPGITDICCSDMSRGIWFIVLLSTCMVLTIGNLAVTTQNPSSSLSWTHFDIEFDEKVDCPNTNNRFYVFTTYQLGLQAVESCFTTSCASGTLLCQTRSYSGTWSGGSLADCNSIGTSMIASYTFALVFSLAGVIVTALGFCIKIPIGRLLTFAFGIIYLALYIQPLAYWYNSCENQIPDYTIYNLADASINSTADDTAPGYAVALAILVVVLSFITVIVNIIRCFRPPAGSSDVGYGGRVLSAGTATSDEYYPSSPPGTIVKPPSPGYYPTR